MRVILAAMLAAAFLVGCTTKTAVSRQTVRPSTRVDSRLTEDPEVRSEMWAHATEVWPRVRLRLGSPTEQYRIPAETAARSEMATAMALWVVDDDRLAGSPSAWNSLVPDDRTEYLIPVLVDDRPVSTLTTHKYGGVWRVWPSRNYFEQAADAISTLDTHFDGDLYTWRFVSNQGIWVVARSADREAGVLIEPWGMGHREGDPPQGVVSDKRLTWWMEHPMGPDMP